MSTDHIHGKVMQFTFDDGPMAHKTFEHAFGEDGTVTYRLVNGSTPASGKPSKVADEGVKYEVAELRDNLTAVSYLGSGGYTLTCVLDFANHTLEAFSSNEKMLLRQHGTFTEKH